MNKNCLDWEERQKSLGLKAGHLEPGSFWVDINSTVTTISPLLAFTSSLTLGKVLNQSSVSWLPNLLNGHEDKNALLGGALQDLYVFLFMWMRKPSLRELNLFPEFTRLVSGRVRIQTPAHQPSIHACLHRQGFSNLPTIRIIWGCWFKTQIPRIS